MCIYLCVFLVTFSRPLISQKGLILHSKFIIGCEFGLKNCYLTGIWLSNIIIGHLTQTERYGGMCVV